MKAITLWRPWPWSFLYPPPELRKRLENRSWPPPPAIIGKRVALHAGLHWDYAGAKRICEILGRYDLPMRAQDQGVIGTVRVVGWHARGTNEDTLSHIPEDQVRWFLGPYAWICEDEHLLPDPILCRGHQGLWDLSRELAPEQIRLVEAA